MGIAAKHKISILGIKKKTDAEMSIMPSADYVITNDDNLMIMAENDTAEKLLSDNKLFVRR